MSEVEKLEPCPFCGGTLIGEIVPARHCRTCNAMGPVAGSPADAIANWNRRDQSQARRVEELEGAWAWLTEQINLSLEYDWPDEGEPGEWQVYRENGGVNDREWTLVGSGETALKAVLEARSALQSRDAHQPSGVTAPDGEVGGGNG